MKIMLTEQAEQELLSVAFGNLGVRTPLNKIREIVLNTVSAHFFDEGLSAKSFCVTIEGLDQAMLIVNGSVGTIHFETQHHISAAG